MSAVPLSISTSATDRRRRRLITEIDSEVSTTVDTESNLILQDNSEHGAAFPMLSGDRLIRRVISPRLWKHITVAIVLTLIPIFYAIATMHAVASPESAEHSMLTTRIGTLRGLSGLKLFAAAQFCLVIGWVRSASPVDFRGSYRSWRWMAIGLFATSLILLTGTNEWVMELIAVVLEPLLGPIHAARPALILVPSAAALALILRRLIPDMGRCRLAQSLVVCSVLALVIRIVAEVRMNTAENAIHLTTLELLISGLLLSAFQLHTRFVIHVNPNPPLAAGRKPAAMEGADQMGLVTPDVIGTKSVEDQTGSPDAANSDGIIENSTVPQPTLVSLPPGSTETAYRRDVVECESQAQAKSSGKAKASKKQEYRNAG